MGSPVFPEPGHRDEGVPLHFGDPLGEQKALLRGALVDRSHLGVVTVTGVDRLPWLHSLTTQYLEGILPGESVQVLILSPHGHIEHDIHFVDDGTTSWLIVEPGTATELVRYLTMMRFLMRVEITDRSADVAVVSAMVDAAIPEAIVTWRAPDAYTRVEHDDDRYVPLRPEAWPAHDYVIPRAALVDVLSRHTQVGTWAWEALRIAAGVPRLAYETDHRTIPHEVGLIASAVHLNKGCYRGQETIARVHNLGRPPRRLVLLHLDGSDDVLPPPGSPIQADGREVGRITSSTHHFELGPIALAVIKRAADAHASLLVVTDDVEVAATQEVVVQP